MKDKQKQDEVLFPKTDYNKRGSYNDSEYYDAQMIQKLMEREHGYQQVTTIIQEVPRV
jgi:hypothetical protein